MTEGDTLWYHGVFAARFVQEGRLDFFPDLGNAAQAFFPANSQVYHAMAFFPFDRDLLSLVFNLAFAPLALLAAYCVGRRRGLGALCVTAVAVVLGLPGIVGVHPGQATNDVLCATFLLVAVALLLEGGIAPLPLALASVASALSLGTKLTVSVPLTVLTVLIVAEAVRRRRPALVVAWLAPLAVFGSFWFLRNWALVDNPLPFYDLHLGPLHFPDRGTSPTTRRSPTTSSSATRGPGCSGRGCGRRSVGPGSSCARRRASPASSCSAATARSPSGWSASSPSPPGSATSSCRSRWSSAGRRSRRPPATASRPCSWAWHCCHRRCGSTVRRRGSGPRPGSGCS